MFGLKTMAAGGARAFHRQETGGGSGGSAGNGASGLAAGLVAGTRVATAMGWRPVEAIARGDLVLTFDRGLQPVREVTRGYLWDSEDFCPAGLWPLHVPEGALGNQQEMMVLPEQSLMLESDTGDRLFGDPFSLVLAAHLEGVRGIERVPPEAAGVEVIQLRFDGDEIVFVNAGALVHCPGLGLIDLGAADEGYDVLPRDAAEILIDGLRDEDALAEDWTPATVQPRFTQACA